MENLLNMMRTWDGLHQVGDGVRHATWSNPSSAAPEILITRKIVRKIYTLMISRESSSLLTCWLSIITIWNKEFANLDQILILEMNFRHVIFNHYLDVTLDLLDFALNKNINPGYWPHSDLAVIVRLVSTKVKILHVSASLVGQQWQKWAIYQSKCSSGRLCYSEQIIIRAAAATRRKVKEESVESFGQFRNVCTDKSQSRQSCLSVGPQDDPIIWFLSCRYLSMISLGRGNFLNTELEDDVTRHVRQHDNLGQTEHFYSSKSFYIYLAVGIWPFDLKAIRLNNRNQ